jgi:hypothetical protein
VARLLDAILRTAVVETTATEITEIRTEEAVRTITTIAVYQGVVLKEILRI